MVETAPPTDDSKKPPKATDKTTVGDPKPAASDLNLTNIVGNGDRRATLTAVRPSGPTIDDGFGITDYTNITAKVNNAGLITAPGGEFAPKSTVIDVKQTGPFVVSQVTDGKVIPAKGDAQDLTTPQAATLKPGDANFIPAGWIQYPPGPAPEVARAPLADTAVISGPPKVIDQGVDATGQHLVQTLNPDGSYITKDTNNQPPRVVAEKDSAGRESKFVYKNGHLEEVDNATGSWKVSADGGTWQNEKGQTFKGSITVNDSNGSFQYQDRSTGVATTWNPDGSHQVQFKDGTKFDGKDFDANGKATRVENGVSTAYALDGTKTVTNPDKSTIQSNPDGQVTKITTPDNKTYEFQYDANGHQTGVKNEYGWWHTKDGATWVNDTDKTSVKGTFNVTSDGTYTFTAAPKAGDQYPSKEIRTADGSVTIQKGDGTSVSTQADGSTVARDNQNRPTLVTSADGKSKYTFSYDGNTTTFTNSKGAWTSTDGQNWALKSDATQTYKGTIGVDEKGNIVQTDAGTGVKHLTQTDGTALEVRPDSSSVQRDKDNRITKETDAGGHSSEFTYNADGTIKSTKNDSGTWTSTDGKTWTNGKDSWTGSMAIDQLTGTTVYQDSKGVKQISNLDGTKVAENPDGSQLQYDKSGRLSTVVDGRGQSSTYGYNGDQLSDIKTPGGSYHSVDGGNTFVSTDGSGKVISGVKVDSSGELSYKDSASNSTVQHLDGSVITSNKAGNVTNVTDGNGKTYTYNYDANNKLTSFTSPAGSFTTTDGGKTFTNGTASITQVAVDKSGTLNYHDSTGANTRLYADGSSYVYKADTSSIETNKFGQVTEIFDAKGNQYSFGYDAKGQLTDVNNADGHWKATDATGTNWVNDNGTKWSGSISVKTDGTYSFTNNFGEKSSVDIKTGDITTRLPDGSGRVQGVNPDTGAKYLKSATDAAGHTVSYDYDQTTGKLKSITDGTNVYTSTDGTTFKGKDGTAYTNLKIGDNGLPQMTDAAGMTHAHQTDGSVITTSKDGQVKQVVDSTGKVNNFDYDAQGLKTITSGGTTLARNSDGTFSDSSTPPKTFKVTVGADGSQQWSSTDGNTQLTIRANGTQHEVNSVNGLPSSTIERDATGKVTSVEDSQDRYTSIKYTNGQPTQINDGASTWTRSADGKSWTSDIQGTPPFKGTVAVDSHGNQTWTDATSKVVNTVNADGSTIKTNPNGSRIETNAYGDTTTYVHAPVNGKQTEVTVDGSGNIQIKNGADGSVLKQDSGSGKFTLTDAQGNVLQTGNGRITVDAKTGNTTITNSDTGNVQVLRADGVGQVANKQANGTYTDASGKPVVVVPPAQIPPVVQQTPGAPVFGPKPNPVVDTNTTPLGKITETAPPIKAPEVLPVVQSTTNSSSVLASPSRTTEVQPPVVNNGPPVYQPPPPQSTFTPPASKIADANTVGLVASTLRVDPPASTRVEASTMSYGGGGPGAAPIVEKISSSSNAPDLFKAVTVTENNSTVTRYTPIDTPIVRSDSFTSTNLSNSFNGTINRDSSVRLDIPPQRVDQQPVRTDAPAPPPSNQMTPDRINNQTEIKAEPIKAPDVVKVADAVTALKSDVTTKADVVTPATLPKEVAPTTPTATPTVEKDAYGHVTSITDSVGNKTLIEYSPGPNGQPVKVSDASGNTVYTLKDGVWTSPGAPPFKGTLTVDASGKQTWTDSATQAFKTISPDGSQMIVKADGSRVSISPDHQTTTYYLAPVNGKVTEVTVGTNGTEIKNSEGYLLRQSNGNVLTVFDPKGNVIKETAGTVTIDSKTGMVTISPMDKTATPVAVAAPVVLAGLLQGYPGTTKDNGTNFYGQPVEVKTPTVPVTVTTVGNNGGTTTTVATGSQQTTSGPVNLGSGGTLNLSTNSGVVVGTVNSSGALTTTGHGTTNTTTTTGTNTTGVNTTGTNTTGLTGTNTTGVNTTGTNTTGVNTTGTNSTGVNTTGTVAGTVNTTTTVNTAGNNTGTSNTGNANTGVVNAGNANSGTINPVNTNVAANTGNSSSQTLNSTATTGTVASLPTNTGNATGSNTAGTPGTANSTNSTSTLNSGANTGVNATGVTGTVNTAGNTGVLNSGSNTTGTINTVVNNSGTVNTAASNAGTLNTGANNSGTLNAGTNNASTINAGANNAGTNNAGTINAGANNAGTNNTVTTAASVINSNSGNSANLSLNSAGNNVNALPPVTVTGTGANTGTNTGANAGTGNLGGTGNNSSNTVNVVASGNSNSPTNLGNASGTLITTANNSGANSGANSAATNSGPGAPNINANAGTNTAVNSGTIASNAGSTLSSPASGNGSNVLGGTNTGSNTAGTLNTGNASANNAGSNSAGSNAGISNTGANATGATGVVNAGGNVNTASSNTGSNAGGNSTGNNAGSTNLTGNTAASNTAGSSAGNAGNVNVASNVVGGNSATLNAGSNSAVNIAGTTANAGATNSGANTGSNSPGAANAGNTSGPLNSGINTASANTGANTAGTINTGAINSGANNSGSNNSGANNSGANNSGTIVAGNANTANTAGSPNSGTNTAGNTGLNTSGGNLATNSAGNNVVISGNTSGAIVNANSPSGANSGLNTGGANTGANASGVNASGVNAGANNSGAIVVNNAAATNSGSSAGTNSGANTAGSNTAGSNIASNSPATSGISSGINSQGPNVTGTVAPNTPAGTNQSGANTGSNLASASATGALTTGGLTNQSQGPGNTSGTIVSNNSSVAVNSNANTNTGAGGAGNANTAVPSQSGQGTSGASQVPGGQGNTASTSNVGSPTGQGSSGTLQSGATQGNAATLQSGANQGGANQATSGTIQTGANQGSAATVQGGASQSTSGTTQGGATQGNPGTLQSGANQATSGTVQGGANQGNAGTLQGGANQATSGTTQGGTSQGNAGSLQGGANQTTSGVTQSGATNQGSSGTLQSGANQGTSGTIQGGANQGSSGTLQSGPNQGTSGTTQVGANQGSSGALQSGVNQGTSGTTQVGANQGNSGALQSGVNQGTSGTTQSGVTLGNSGTLQGGVAQGSAGASQAGVTQANSGPQSGANQQNSALPGQVSATTGGVSLNQAGTSGQLPTQGPGTNMGSGQLPTQGPGTNMGSGQLPTTGPSAQGQGSTIGQGPAGQVANLGQGQGANLGQGQGTNLGQGQGTNLGQGQGTNLGQGQGTNLGQGQGTNLGQGQGTNLGQGQGTNLGQGQGTNLGQGPVSSNGPLPLGVTNPSSQSPLPLGAANPSSMPQGPQPLNSTNPNSVSQGPPSSTIFGDQNSSGNANSAQSPIHKVPSDSVDPTNRSSVGDFTPPKVSDSNQGQVAGSDGVRTNGGGVRDTSADPVPVRVVQQDSESIKKSDTIKSDSLAIPDRPAIADRPVDSSSTDRKQSPVDSVTPIDRPHTAADANLPTDRSSRTVDISVPTDRPQHVADISVPTDRPQHVADISVPTDRPQHVADISVPTDRPQHVADISVPTDRPQHVADTSVSTDRPQHVADTSVSTDRPQHVADTVSTDRPQHVVDTSVPTDRSQHVADTSVPTDRPQHATDTSIPTDRSQQASDTSFPTDPSQHAADATGRLHQTSDPIVSSDQISPPDSSGAMQTGPAQQHDWSGQTAGASQSGSAQQHDWSGQTSGTSQAGPAQQHESSGQTPGASQSGPAQQHDWSGQPAGSVQSGSMQSGSAPQHDFSAPQHTVSAAGHTEQSSGKFDSASAVSSTNAIPLDPNSVQVPLAGSGTGYGVINPGNDPGLPSGLPNMSDPGVPGFVAPPGAVDFTIQQVPEIPLNTFDLHSVQHHGQSHGHHADEHGHGHHTNSEHTNAQHSTGQHTNAQSHDGHMAHTSEHSTHQSEHRSESEHSGHSVTHQPSENEHRTHANHSDHEHHSQIGHSSSDDRHGPADGHAVKHEHTAHEGTRHNVDEIAHQHEQTHHHGADQHVSSHGHSLDSELPAHIAGRREPVDSDYLPPANRIESADQLDTPYASSRQYADPYQSPDVVSSSYEDQIRRIAEEAIRELEGNREEMKDYSDKLAAAHQSDLDQYANYQQQLADRKESADQLDADYRTSLEDQKRREEEDRRRREDEEKLRKQEDDIRRLSDTMMTAMTTRRQAELDEQVRRERLREDQIRREKEIRQDNKQETYIVKPKDTLESITKKKLGSIELLPLVYELNKTKIQLKYAENGTPLYIVKAGTVLHLPSRKQVREYRQRKLSQSANNLRAQHAPGSPEAKADEARRANIENMLGPISGGKHDDVLRYTVRLGDSLRSVAMKHPALNDINLWKLVARKNGLPLTTDSKGLPTASLRRGSHIIIPSPSEIAQYRLTMTGENLVAMQSRSEHGPRTELATTQCPSCKRLITASSTVCPACAFPIAAADAPSDEHTRAVSTTRVSNPPPVADWDETIHAPAVPEVGDTTLRFNNSILKFSSRSDRDPDTTLSFAARRLEFESGKVLSFGPLTGETTLSFERPVPTGVPSVRLDEEILESTTEQLSDNCRMVKSQVKRNVSELTRSQLEVLRDNEWIPILSYEVSNASSMRHEYLANGTKRSIMIDLPASAASEMIQNDLASNWLTYSKKFLAGKRLTA